MSQKAGDEPGVAQAGSKRQARQVSRRHAAKNRWTLLKETAGILVLAVMMSLVVKTLLIQAFFIPSGSMEPALHGCEGCFGDRVLVNRLADKMGGVQRGDIVVFRDSNGWLSETAPTRGLGGQLQDVLATIGLAPTTGDGELVKRVIGIGGDTVEARDNTVYVNGTPLDEPYVLQGDSPSEISFRVTVPAGKLWVMGDHRSESADSRYHVDDPGKGFVPLTDVVGRVFVIIWPLDRVGALGRPATFDKVEAPEKHPR